MNNQINIINSIINEAKSHDDFNDISFEKIIKIHITVIDKNIEWLARVIPASFDNDLLFEIYIQNFIIDDLLSDNNDKASYAKSIILHELYHIKELTITNRKINIIPIYSIKRSSTQAMIINLGYKQWSEYYAHYNSTKYYCPPVNLSNVIYQSEITLTVIKRQLDSSVDIQLPENMYNSIENFVSQVIKLAAIYNQSQNDNYLNDIQKYQNDTLYVHHYNFIYKIIAYMDNLYKTYPNWISEKQFLLIGKEIFSIIHDYNITYSTDDLSDNFIFKSLK